MPAIAPAPRRPPCPKKLLLPCSNLPETNRTRPTQAATYLCHSCSHKKPLSKLHDRPHTFRHRHTAPQPSVAVLPATPLSQVFTASQTRDCDSLRRRTASSQTRNLATQSAPGPGPSRQKKVISVEIGRHWSTYVAICRSQTIRKHRLCRTTGPFPGDSRAVYEGAKSTVWMYNGPSPQTSCAPCPRRMHRPLVTGGCSALGWPAT